MFDADDVIIACQKLYDTINQCNSMRYQCTFDAFLVTNSSANIHARLIEINSDAFGWGPAGSSLFSWKYNPPPQQDEPPVYSSI